MPARLQENNSGTINEKVASWINSLTEKYPHVKFHLFGSLDYNRLLNKINIYSADGTAWIIGAAKHNPIKKKETAAINILRLEVFDNENDYFEMEKRINNKYELPLQDVQTCLFV